MKSLEGRRRATARASLNGVWAPKLTRMMTAAAKATGEAECMMTHSGH